MKRKWKFTMISSFGLTDAPIQIRPVQTPDSLLLFPFRAYSFIMQWYYFALSRRCDAFNSRETLRSGGPNNNESDLGNSTRARLICYIAVASICIRINGRLADPAFPTAACFPQCPLFLSTDVYFNVARLCTPLWWASLWSVRSLNRRPSIKSKSAFDPIAIDFWRQSVIFYRIYTVHFPNGKPACRIVDISAM